MPKLHCPNIRLDGQHHSAFCIVASGFRPIRVNRVPYGRCIHFDTVYDPTVGTGGMLSIAEEHFIGSSEKPEEPLKLSG